MSRTAQNSGLATPNPMGNEDSGHFTKNGFDGKCMKCPDVHTNLHVCQSPLLIGEGWGDTEQTQVLFGNDLLYKVLSIYSINQ